MQSCNLKFLSESEFQTIPEDDIGEGDKVYIAAITSRLRRILNWDAGEVEQMYERQRGPQIIREFLSHFYRWKEFVNQTEALDTQRIQHLVIFNIARLSLYYWVMDTAIVAEVLSEMFECNGHFSSMFAHVVNRNDSRSLLRQTADYDKQREDFATIFFLHHAYKGKLLFNGVRFCDVRLRFPLNIPPVFLTVVYNKVHILLHLLQFGAKVDFPISRMPDEWNLPMLLRHLLRVLWNYLGEVPRYEDAYPPVTSTMSSSIQKTAECLSILLRVIPQIQMGDLNFLLMRFERGVLIGSVCSHEFIRQLSENNVVPKLVHRYLEPSELQHLCRCVIRNVLNIAWNLPYGISLLPLPTRVKNYLSLAED